MTKYYGSEICGDCVEANRLFKEKNFKSFEYVCITESVMNLKEFLNLRDTRPEFEEIRKGGFIGIPCFLLDDGSLIFDPEELMKK